MSASQSAPGNPECPLDTLKELSELVQAHARPILASLNGESDRGIVLQGTSLRKMLEAAEAVEDYVRAVDASRFDDDPIALQHLPPHVARKARRVIGQVENGCSLRSLDGKRLRFNRHLFSVALNQSYRLILTESDDGFSPVEVLTHEAYNTRYSGGRQSA